MALSKYQDPIGWPFLPKPVNGALSYPTLEESVKNAIRIILTTRPGEQLMTPNFAAGLQNYLDEGNTIAIRRQIQQTIEESLQKYENRIAVSSVDVSPVAGAPAEVHVLISYRLLRTNTQAQTSVTMQVG